MATVLTLSFQTERFRNKSGLGGAAADVLASSSGPEHVRPLSTNAAPTGPRES